MATPIEILISARDNASSAIKQVDAAITQLGNDAQGASTKIEAAGQRAGKGFSSVSDKIDSVGRNAKTGLGAAAQAADLLGLNIGGVVAPAMGAADAIGDIAGSVGTLGLAAGVVGIAITAIAALVSVLDRQRDALAKNILANNEFIVSIRGFTAANQEAAAQAQELATTLANQSNPLHQLGDGIAGAVEGFFGLNDATRSLQGGLESLGIVVSTNAERADILVAKLKEEEAAFYAAQYAAAALSAELAGMASLDPKLDNLTDGKFKSAAQEMAELRTQTWFANHEFKEGTGWVLKSDLALQKWATSGAKSAEAAAQRLTDKLKGLVENALAPTATAEGADTWDEARKRFEAFASGTDTAAYGEDFKKMFDSLGMSAEEAARRFKDFSLFALKPDLLKTDLIGWQQITDQVNEQLLSMAGKAMVTKAAMAEVWKNLSPQAKSALAEQGIDNAAEALTALTDPAQKAQQDVKGLNDQINAIPQLVTTTFDAVTTSAKAAIQDLATFLDTFINAYGSITVSANGEFSSPTSGGSTGDPTFTEDAPPPSYYAHGTDFTVPGGFPNDSYKVNARLSSGERMIVIPKNQNGGRGGNNFYFNVTVDSEARGNALSRKVRALAANGMA